MLDSMLQKPRATLPGVETQFETSPYQKRFPKKSDWTDTGFIDKSNLYIQLEFDSLHFSLKVQRHCIQTHDMYLKRNSCHDKTICILLEIAA